MSDLISRQAVWDIIAKLHSEYITKEQEQRLERLDVMIGKLPSAYRPSIVRCGECKHWSEKEKQEAMSGRWTSICRYFSEYNENLVNEIYTGENAFCSYGERREP